MDPVHIAMDPNNAVAAMNAEKLLHDGKERFHLTIWFSKPFKIIFDWAYYGLKKDFEIHSYHIY